MGIEAREAPGPVLVTSHQVVAVATGRDLAADVGDVEAAQRNLTDGAWGLASDYADFLNAINESGPTRKVVYALDHVFEATSAAALEAMYADHPELASELAIRTARDRVEQSSEGEERHVALAVLALLEAAAKGRFAEAWAGFEEAIIELSTRYIEPRVEALTDQLQAAMRQRDWPAAYGLAEDLIALGRVPGAEYIEAPAAMRGAVALIEMPGDGRAGRFEQAISLLTRAVEIYETNPDLSDPLELGHTLQNLGTAYAGRLQGDPVANQTRAIQLQGRALELLTLENDADGWAMSHTNLALSMLELAQMRDRPEFDWEAVTVEDKQVDSEIDRAIEHLEIALTWRSFDRDTRDWAYTQINLGLAYSRRRLGDRRTNINSALEHYAEAARGFRAAADDALTAQVLHNMSTDKLQLAHLDDTPEDASQQLLAEAAADARAALDLQPLAEAPVHAGRTYRQLGDCLVALHDREGAIEAYRNALLGVSPDTSPRDARGAARALAELHSQAADWQSASDAWETAALAAARAWESRSTAVGREVELRDSLNVARWAAYALARAGRPERAVELLEQGRARQLIHWMGHEQEDIERLHTFDPALEQSYRELHEAYDLLERSRRGGLEPSVGETARISDSLALLVESIRALPGFKSFLSAPSFETAASAVRASEALVYLVTSPNGSLALVVSESSSVDVIEAPA